MASKKPDLDDATLEIARKLLSTPPKPHDEMKVGKRKIKQIAQRRRRKVATPNR